jgi:sporulation protein YlmC with PRC-barrel domain
MIKASDLIGCVVSTQSGRKLGRVHDLRASCREDGWLLSGLVIAKGGMLARLGASGASGGPTTAGDVIAWQAVTHLGDGQITIRDDSAASGPHTQ